MNFWDFFSLHLDLDWVRRNPKFDGTAIWLSCSFISFRQENFGHLRKTCRPVPSSEPQEQSKSRKAFILITLNHSPYAFTVQLQKFYAPPFLRFEEDVSDVCIVRLTDAREFPKGETSSVCVWSMTWIWPEYELLVSLLSRNFIFEVELSWKFCSKISGYPNMTWSFPKIKFRGSTHFRFRLNLK